ncbi:hypothetical protein [Candidatus Izimaplasma sp. HR1]|jgi:uncharacterized membrane protein YczE|uniref:hypothetical protein n=1 Tax=Candidatus Izimoplasma sp. HR1 TaxID=1541959 RepID=UPI00056FCCD2
MRTIIYLLIAILGNALGTAIMAETNLGMTAWGSGASNTASFFNLTIGQAFIVLSIIFYVLATFLRRKFILKEMMESTVFLLAFSFLADYFITLMPDLSNLGSVLLLLINILGMLVLMFSIAVHIRLHRFVHPMDIFLSVLQTKLHSISKGTYLAYSIGFCFAIVFGLLAGGITDIGVGTVITLVSSGMVMKYYNKWILDKWKFAI